MKKLSVFSVFFPFVLFGLIFSIFLTVPKPVLSAETCQPNLNFVSNDLAQNPTITATILQGTIGSTYNVAVLNEESTVTVFIGEDTWFGPTARLDIVIPNDKLSEGNYLVHFSNKDTGEKCPASPLFLPIADSSNDEDEDGGGGSGDASKQEKIPASIDKPEFGGDAVEPAREFATTVLNFGVGAAGGLAFLLMVFGAYRLTLSGGNPEAVQQGREVITAAVAGLLIIIFAIFLLNFLGYSILGIDALNN